MTTKTNDGRIDPLNCCWMDFEHDFEVRRAFCVADDDINF